MPILKKTVCDLCGKEGGFLKNKLESITLLGRNFNLHRQCMSTMREKIEEEKDREEMVKNENLARQAYQIYTENELRKDPKRT